jgi:hypothetical protein
VRIIGFHGSLFPGLVWLMPNTKIPSDDNHVYLTDLLLLLGYHDALLGDLYVSGYMAFWEQLNINPAPIFIILLMNNTFSFLIHLQIIKWQKKLRYMWGKRLCIQHLSHNMVCWILGGFETIGFILNGCWNFFLYPVWNVIYVKPILVVFYPILILYLISIIIGVAMQMIVVRWQDPTSWNFEEVGIFGLVFAVLYLWYIFRPVLAMMAEIFPRKKSWFGVNKLVIFSIITLSVTFAFLLLTHPFVAIQM